MKKFIDKAKATKPSHQENQPAFSSSGQTPANHSSSGLPYSIKPPSALDVIRYRYHHGANLGSIFVLEKWLFGSMFPPSSSGGSELDAVSASVKTNGLGATKVKWERHWSGAVSDEDLQWLVSAKCTSIRLPIGYFTLGRDFCHGTPFHDVAGVYENAWNAVKMLVSRLRSVGIGSLIDVHALPGGANKDAHSGSSSGTADFWENRTYQKLATQCLNFIAKEVKDGMDGVIGIQLVNEAVWDAKGMYAWYDEVSGEIANIDDSIPIYISDGWDLGRALNWTNQRHPLKGGRYPRNPVVIDTHKYYTFSDKDRSQTPAQIIGRIGGELTQLNGKEGSLVDHGEGQVIIGEYSCVLDGQTWNRVRPEDKNGLVAQFGREQSKKWQQRAGGAYFWTYKMQWMDGGEWGFVEQVKKGNVTPPAELLISLPEVKVRAQAAQQRRGELSANARRSHEEYWNRTVPGKRFEHERYSDGWNVGFSDALSFFTMRADGGLGNRAGEGGDRIGCLDIWVKKRLLESGQQGEFVWEWEQGLRAGIKAFNKVVEI